MLFLALFFCVSIPTNQSKEYQVIPVHVMSAQKRNPEVRETGSFVIGNTILPICLEEMLSLFFKAGGHRNMPEKTVWNKGQLVLCSKDMKKCKELQQYSHNGVCVCSVTLVASHSL